MTDEPDIPPTRDTQLARAERILAAAGSPAPRREAAELLSHVLGVSVTGLPGLSASPMRQDDARTYDDWIARRAAGEAVAHITGHLEFMGLDIVIGQGDPLAPPGAQQIVETALEWARRRAPGELLAAEMSTGCGAVALALAALEPRFTRIHAVDSRAATLQAARANGARYLLNLVISWLEGEGLDVIPEPVDLIVCGQSGWIASNCERALAKLRSGGALICAVDDAQRPLVVDMLASSYPAMPVWVEAQGDGLAIVVVQRSRDQEGN